MSILDLNPKQQADARKWLADCAADPKTSALPVPSLLAAAITNLFNVAYVAEQDGGGEAEAVILRTLDTFTHMLIVAATSAGVPVGVAAQKVRAAARSAAHGRQPRG